MNLSITRVNLGSGPGYPRNLSSQPPLHLIYLVHFSSKPFLIILYLPTRPLLAGGNYGVSFMPETGRGQTLDFEADTRANHYTVIEYQFGSKCVATQLLPN